MSLWGFDGEDNSLTTWSSLSQFDDMVWNEFGETNGDHVVPNPSSPNSSWLPNGDRSKRIFRESSLPGSTSKGESAMSMELADSVSLSSEVEKLSTESLLPGITANLSENTSEDEWTGIERGAFDRTAESEPFGSEHPPTSQETDETVVEVEKGHQSVKTMKGDCQFYNGEEDASMVTDPFSISDVGSQDGALEIFESENVVSKADTLLELGWENISNLDDMDKLFRNNDTSFEPVLVNGAEVLDWPSSSSPPVGTLDSDIQFEKSSPVSASIAAKVEVVESKDKREAVLDDSLPGLMMNRLDDAVATNDDPTSLNISVDTPVQLHSLPCEDNRDMSQEAKPAREIVLPKDRPTEGTGVSNASLCKTEKVSMAQAHRARRHASNRKRSEDRFKRITSYRKLSPGPPYNAQIVDGRQLQSRPLRISGRPPLLQPATTYPLQYFPPTATPGVINAPHQLQMSQGVPYIQVAYPVHRLPAMSCPSVPVMQMQRPQFVDIQQSVSQGQVLLPQASPLVSSWAFDVSNRPPTSSLHMTPQEKMDKLRWRQQMQARMAVEQQQQQLLASHNADGIDQTYQKQQAGTCHDSLPNHPRRPLKCASDPVMNPSVDPPEASQRLLVDGNLPSTNDNGDYSFEASVLYQLRTTVSALEVGTRVCIRDALYRLARSAMKRRAAGTDHLNGSQESKDQDSDAYAVESSTASVPPSSRHSQGTSMSAVETQTNPIDRSIAKLLFSKPQPAIFARPYAYI